MTDIEYKQAPPPMLTYYDVVDNWVNDFIYGRRVNQLSVVPIDAPKCQSDALERNKISKYLEQESNFKHYMQIPAKYYFEKQRMATYHFAL